MKAKIVYDTISFKSTFEFSNQTIQDNLEQFLKSTEEKRITDWFENFASAILNEINGDSIDLTIDGCDEYEENFIKDVLKVDKLNSITPIFENTIDEEALAQKYKLIDDFFYVVVNSDNEIIKNNFEKDQQENYKNWTSSVIELPVLATMSSGKSTFLNAMIGQDYLHEDLRSTTATTCTIVVNNDESEFIASATDKDSRVTNEDENISIKAFLEEWNARSNKNQDIKLQLEGPVKNLDNNHFQLHFIDTPGPNASENQHHQQQTYEYLQGKGNLPLVMYVIDLENVDSNDDNNTFKEIHNILNENKQAGERIIFILNKIDQVDIEKRSIENSINDLKKDLENRYDIKNPLIFPITSMYAKLAQILPENLGRNSRKSLNSFRETINPEIEDNYLGYQLLENAPLTENQKQLIWDKVEKGELEEDLVYSGLAAIKLYIEDYIKNHHKKNQYKALNDTYKAILNAILNSIALKKNELEVLTSEQEVENKKTRELEISELEIKKTELIHQLNRVDFDNNIIGHTAMYFDQLNDLKKEILRLAEQAKIIEDAKIKPSEDPNLILLKLKKQVNHTYSSYLATLSTNSERLYANYVDNLKRVSHGFYQSNIDSITVTAFKAKMNSNINAINVNSFTKNTQYEEQKEVKSRLWIKRIFDITDTITVKKTTRIVDWNKIYNDVVQPLSIIMYEENENYIKSTENTKDKLKQLFIKSINSSFEKNKKNIYKDLRKDLYSIYRDKNLEILKLNNLIKSFDTYKNEKI